MKVSMLLCYFYFLFNICNGNFIGHEGKSTTEIFLENFEENLDTKSCKQLQQGFKTLHKNVWNFRSESDAQYKTTVATVNASFTNIENKLNSIADSVSPQPVELTPMQVEFYNWQRKQLQSNQSLVPGYPKITEEVEIDFYYGYTFVTFKTLKLNFVKSFIKCKTHGMHLTYFDSKEEFNFQADLVRKYIQNPSPDKAWIGATDLLTEGNFTWLLSGQPFNSWWKSRVDPKSTHWLLNQPDNYNNVEHCTCFLKNKDLGNDSVIINDWYCEYEAGIICKYEASKSNL